MKSYRIEGVIFDFDGVIADSEPIHCRAFLEVFPQFGLPTSATRRPGMMAEPGASRGVEPTSIERSRTCGPNRFLC